jgi:hypothetical protein
MLRGADPAALGNIRAGPQLSTRARRRVKRETQALARLPDCQPGATRAAYLSMKRLSRLLITPLVLLGATGLLLSGRGLLGELYRNLKTELDSFRERTKSAPGEVQVEHRPGYSGGRAMEGGWAGALVLLGVARWLSIRERRR